MSKRNTRGGKPSRQRLTYPQRVAWYLNQTSRKRREAAEE